MPRQPAGQVKEMEVPELSREPANLGREGLEQGAPQGRLVVHQSIEGVPSQDLRLHGDERHGRRGPGSAIEQGQFPEESTRRDGRQDRGLGAVARWDRDLHPTGGHDEQSVTGVVGVEDRLSASESARAKCGGHHAEDRRLQASEEAAFVQRVLRQGRISGAPNHAANRTRGGSVTRAG
jgi:hypothetical protein